ncbi:endo-1,3-1,4-beta-glycanase ExoK [Aminobacter niigataensis]|uniref:Endo-1,3-1,4-beta-glycanase ExoK n=1 Tax=Aminobacter niigataensis TaxID=83265 RepID=A0ABR6LA12_9HYPH|nr:glycoside hydrolase family 16 protein [Aminobacter niigataensis]MBB4653054.1 endo-1,3-1,4-beta-glycanase ExoK [Aminobacter niigataensis]
MNANVTHHAAGRIGRRSWGLRLSVALAGLLAASGGALAQDATGKSFVETFDTLSGSRWFVSDGWDNGKHQNCTWSKEQVKVADGNLTLSFEKKPLKDRDYSCGEVQTKQRFSYGTYEARMKSGTGSGLNAAFFTYIGPVHKQPHDEIDFEVLTKDPSKVQVNAYVGGKSNDEKLVDVSGGADQAFNDYAFVWEKERLRWYVNGQLVHEVTEPSQLPSHPQKIFFSLWGTDTLREWMGAFSDPGKPVTMAVDRVAFTALGEPCQFKESVACTLQ